MEYEIVDVDSVECVGKFEDEYVYDIEMSDDTNHTFFANDILVHNSLYLSFQDVIKKLRIEGDQKDKIKACRTLGKIAMHQLDKFNTVWFDETFNADNMIFWDQELISDRAIFIKRKKYTCHIVEEKGFPTDDLLVKGLEVVRSSTTKVFREKIKESITMILKGCSQEEFNDYANDLYEQFLTWGISEIYLPKSCNNLSKFDRGGLHGIKGTPGHMRAAIAFNFYLKQYGLNEIEPIKEGDKFKMIYLEKNSLYPIAAIGFLDKMPKEFKIDESFVDRQKHFELSYTQPMENILNAIGWKLPNFFDDAIDISDLPTL
jgi:DNA polymerase elongation subunit (family B)